MRILTRSALQHVIFNLHVAMGLPGQSAKLLQALDVWHRLWTNAMSKLPEDDQKWLGVTRHVPDIGSLSRRIIEIAGTNAQSPYLQRIPSYGATQLHEFIRDFVKA
jgi:hypothetical protein